MVPVFDLRSQYERMRDEILDELREVADSLQFISGPKVASFEAKFAHALGVKRCVGVNSGTSALHLALLGAGVGAGDEVITVPFTFIATSWAISYIGATPVYVDVAPDTFTMDMTRVEERITSRTRAFLPVHLYGQACNLEPLQFLSQKYGIPIVEDAAQAYGATYRGRSVATFGTTAGFSFYPGKNLGAGGEAGAVVTNDDRIADRLMALRDHAQYNRYSHEEIGFNYRMDSLQGAILGVKLQYAEQWVAERRRLAARYLEELEGLPIQLPIEAQYGQHAWHLFVVMHPKRDQLREMLLSMQVSSALHYPRPLHLRPAYQHLNHRCGDFPVAERAANECLSLPLFPEMTEDQQSIVIDAVRTALVGGVWK
jgi:dTDP-4-amino-4,6-dideoxygalactose transaminase